MEQENIQTEIGILQKKILAFKPCIARIIIPAIMGTDKENYLEIPMPVHLAVTYGDKVIPEGTRFIVQAISGDYNNIKIIGYCDEPKSFDFISLMKKYILHEENIFPEDYGVFPYDEI